MRSPARQSSTTKARMRAADTVAGLAHDRDDLLDRGRIGRVAEPHVAWLAPGEIAGQGDGRAEAAGAIQQWHGHGTSSVDEKLILGRSIRGRPHGRATGILSIGSAVCPRADGSRS
jgi:hypothetical protein